MSEIKVIFVLDGISLIIQGISRDKMKDICQRYVTKINKNINELMFLYGGNQINFELNFDEQANFIDKNNKEMKILVYKNELNGENEKQLNEIKKTIINDDLKIERINYEIDELNKKNISKCLLNFDSNYHFLYEELHKLKDLEKKFGFLSSLGIKFLLKPGEKNRLEGFIRAPDNSPYKDGIFNFDILFPGNYPDYPPNIRIKTKIFHTEVNPHDNKCCIYFFNYSKKNFNLPLILSTLFQFFLGNTSHGYGNDATRVFRDKSISEFEQLCQKYTKKYALSKFDERLEYLFQDYYDIKNNLYGSNYIFYDIENQNAIKAKIDGLITFEILQKYFGPEIDSSNTVLIARNKVYYHMNNYKELLENHIIFVSPDTNMHMRKK